MSSPRAVAPQAPSSLVFLDPPYGHSLAEKALASAHLAAGSRPAGSLSSRKRQKSAFVGPEGFSELERRRYDDSEFVFLRMS